MRRIDRAAALLAGLHVAAGLLLSPAWIRPDSVGVYAWLRSALLDGDFLFFDEWAGFGLIRGGITTFKEITATGALGNHWGIGTTILTSPFYLLARPFGSASDGGFFGIHTAVLCWTSVVFAAAASLLFLRVARDEGLRDRPAVLAAIFVWLGTPLFWYEIVFPLGSHLAGTLGVALVVWAITRPAGKPEDDFWIGLAFGIAVAARVQHVVLAPALALHLWRTRRRPSAAMAVGALIPLAVQAVAWTAVYGQPFGPLIAGSSPHGATWTPFARVYVVEALFSSYHGLVSWAPVTALAVVGMLVEVRRRPLAATLLLAFLCELVANGLFDRYFWGGMSFGPRRFVDLAVPMMIGLAWFLSRTGAAGLAAATLATGWSSLLLVAAAQGTLDLRRDVTFADLFRAIGAIDPALAAARFGGMAGLGQMPFQMIGGLAIAAALVASGIAILRSRRRSAAALALLCFAWLFASLGAIRTTRARAAGEAARHAIRIDASRIAGPLLDARGLLADEESYLRRRGRSREADETAALRRAIDERLHAAGVP
ncbi:MAG TPA: hypothetical protein VM557_10450 [Thermoanaerobaculia bacterium]|nr:hypothetical protein [Thermoanaerobaculia bacterium]